MACTYKNCTFPRCDCPPGSAILTNTGLSGPTWEHKANHEDDIAAERKATPVYSGVIKYFPDALQEVARVSYIGNEQHNPGQPLHWDRSKSQDELDALSRHLTDHATVDMDGDGCLHLAKVAWRALAALQKHLEDS